MIHIARKRFRNDHVRRGNSKSGCRPVGSDTSALLATIAESQTSCHFGFYIRSGQVQPQWFSGTKPDWWVGKHIVVDWPVLMELYLLYENISCGFTLQISRCNVVQCLFVVFQLQCIVSLALCSFFNTIGPTFGGSSSESSTSIATCNR